MRIFTTLLLALISLNLFAQDTIKIMQYNLLNYGNTTSWCTTENNNMNDKDIYLKTIINYVKPDIFTVNEMAGNTYVIQRLMDSTLNVNGIDYYKKANYTGSYLVNMLYYNSEKLILESQDFINTTPRIIDIYKLYYNSPDLSTMNDTAFIFCIVAHLKAGTGTSEQNERANSTNMVMNYLDSINTPGNYFFMGDLNVYTSSENAFQNLINFSNSQICFNDPINEIGSWHDNSSYSSYHTQSTHTTSGCASSGGMDDRFDFILISNNILNGTDKVKYIANTYKALGQDGQRLNQTINNPTNNSIPSNIADALYGMSDHIPVILNLKIEQTPAIINNIHNNKKIEIIIQNPVKDKLNIYLELNKKSKINIRILSLSGQVLIKKQINNISKYVYFSIPLNNIKTGMYILKITDKYHNQIIKKFIKI